MKSMGIKQKITGLAFGLNLFCGSMSVLATDESAIERLSKLSLKELLEVQVEVTSLHDESVLYAPSSVTVFTRQEILDMGVRTVEELLNFVPGFQASRETFVNQSFRVGARGTLSPQPAYNILFLIDGQRLNTDLSGGALFANRFITTANIERIEVIRGPGSALYGTSAFSGVVNIITTRDTNDVYIGAGNLDSREVYANLSKEHEEWKASGFIRYYDDDGQSYGPDLTTQVNPGVFTTEDPYSTLDLYGTLSWDNRIRIDARHAERDMEDFISFTTLLDGFAGNESYSDSIALSAKLFDTTTWGLDARLSYKRDRIDEFESFGGNLGKFEYDSSEWEFRLDGNYLLSGHDIRAGATYRRPETHDWQFVVRADGRVIPNGPEDGRDIVGVYLQDQFEFTDTLRTTLGVRMDWYSDVGTSLNPRAALIYTPVPSTGLKLLYGEAFRAPNRFQSGDFFLGNPSIDSEKIRTLETVWLQDYSQWLLEVLSLQSTLTWFRSWHEDRIFVQPGAGPFGLITANDNETLTTSGFEAELSAGFGKYFSLRAAYMYLPETEENPQNFVSDAFSFIANYHRGRWNLNLNTIYHGEAEQVTNTGATTSIISLDDYWVLNATVGFELIKHIRILGRVYNLADENYHSPTAVPVFSNGLENRGRTFTLGVEFTW